MIRKILLIQVPVKLLQVPNIFVRVKQVLLMIVSRVSILLVSQH